MNATGIGYAGIDGAWWLPAVTPFTLPVALADELRRFGAAVFALFDTLAELYESDSAVRALLLHAVPPHIPRLAGRAPLLMARPDFQLVPDGADYRLVATEIEVCPAAQGFAHAMQIGYELATDLADTTARLLEGRPLLIIGASARSEFLFEQLAFCRALAERGATARVVYDRPMTALAAEVEAERRWVPPLFGVPARPDGWNTDVLGRIRAAGLDDYLWPGDPTAPDGPAVIFRFGYFDTFTPEMLHDFTRRQAAGATFLNPPITWLENKAVLAAARLPAVREQLAALDPALPAALDRGLPETYVLTSEMVDVPLADREAWLIKFAGFDGDNRAWGGRSIRFGGEHTAASWAAVVREAAALPWPVVAQRVTPSTQLDVDYYDADGAARRLSGGHTRLRSFLLREQDGSCRAVGTHLTVSAEARVAEAVGAVQGPVEWRGKNRDREIERS